VPQYKHHTKGKLSPVETILAGGPLEGETVDLKWGAFLQPVAYGEAARDRVVDGLIDTVERIRETTDGGFNFNVGNCISQTHALVHRLPLVKHKAFDDEQEHRITITEHFGGRSFSHRLALSALGEPFSYLTQGALETVERAIPPRRITNVQALRRAPVRPRSPSQGHHRTLRET
jgi:hypothetical protein